MFDRALYQRAAEDLRKNKGQWDAYNSTGHCVVLAGPGSGKTKTLTIKLARVLAEDVEEPRGVACLTYNNECVKELERRLGTLGVESGPRVFIGTVHSFALTQIILPYAKTAALGLPEDFRVATRNDQKHALERAYNRVINKGENPQDWELGMSRHRRSILNRNSEAWRTEDPELSKLVEAYEADLRKRGMIDFDDMPLLAVRALAQHQWIQRSILAKYPVLVVDEYQDLGRALHAMVMGLCFSTGIRLFAVGDADQSIYGFIGAYPEHVTVWTAFGKPEELLFGFPFLPSGVSGADHKEVGSMHDAYASSAEAFVVQLDRDRLIEELEDVWIVLHLVNAGKLDSMAFELDGDAHFPARVDKIATIEWNE